MGIHLEVVSPSGSRPPCKIVTRAEKGLSCLAEAILSSEDSVMLAAIRPGCLSPQPAETSGPQPPALRAPARQGGVKERGKWQPRGKGRQQRRPYGEEPPW